MPDLIAQGADPSHRWRLAIPVEGSFVLGRAGRWGASWDAAISREHAVLKWRNGALRVESLPTARNPIYFRGRTTDRFLVKPGEHFVIGETTFTPADEKAQATLDAPPPDIRESFSPQALKRVRYRHAEQRIEVLNRLPELISGAASDRELFGRIVNVLLAGIARAETAAVVRCRTDDAPQEEDAATEVLHWDRRRVAGGDFAPSDRLIQEAVRRGESVLHVWRENRPSEFTQRAEADWAFCIPLAQVSCRGWALYVEGNLADGPSGTPEADAAGELREELKFAELVATTLGALRENRLLERQQAGLRQFFSPLVLEALANESPEMALKPRETEVSVLFCDLRGFSRTSERQADDLMGLLQRVSKALGVTTRHILDQGGVVGDFQGDAVMGFWGWPLPQPDQPLRVCQAALGIRSEFAAAARRAGHPLAGFQIGIGIATGRAVAGKIGTVDQVKVTVFGPVVNLASRMEGMTKYLRAAIVIDETTARQARQTVPAELARFRKLAIVQPYGLESSHTVYELLPPESEYPSLSGDDIATYEAGWEALAAGDWERAWRLLHQLPAGDEVKDFLTVFIAQHHRAPPADWNGVIALSRK